MCTTDNSMNDYWKNHDTFEYIKSLFGNEFAAVNYLASKAREKAEEYDNHISHSEALNWIYTGMAPDSIDNIINRLSEEDIVMNEILETMTQIDTQTIKDAVFDSMCESIDNHHLIYVYKGINNSADEARVRIICNMIWDAIH